MTYKEIAIELTGSCQKGYTSFEVEAKAVKKMEKEHKKAAELGTKLSDLGK